MAYQAAAEEGVRSEGGERRISRVGEWTMRLGEGELTMHHRDGDRHTPITCGASHGCITAVWADVTCAECLTKRPVTRVDQR